MSKKIIGVTVGTTINPKKIAEELAGSLGQKITTDETLTLKDGVLSVNRATEVEKDNTLPITAAAVHTTVGNIEILLGTI